MHEMSLAMSVMDMARRTVLQHPGASLAGVELTVGDLAGVEPQAFDTAMRCALAGSPWPEAEYGVTRVPGRARCLRCGHEFDASALYAECPACGSGACGIVAGTELSVRAIRLNMPD